MDSEVDRSAHSMTYARTEHQRQRKPEEDFQGHAEPTGVAPLTRLGTREGQWDETVSSTHVKVSFQTSET